MTTSDGERLISRLILGLLLGGLLLLAYQVLNLFLIPVLWAAILAYVTWPAYRCLTRELRGRSTASALLMTLLLTAVFALPLLWLIALLRVELPYAYQALTAYLHQGPQVLPAYIVDIPWLGQQAQALFERLASDKDALGQYLAELGQPWIDEIASILGGFGRNALKFGIALVTVFFIYRDGESLLHQTRQVLTRFLGDRAQPYLHAIGTTTQAVVYGLVLTALAQGLLAGLGYWAAGVPAPVLLGAATAAIAMIPFGPPLIWVPAGVWLLLNEQLLAGIGLLLWGALVVSWIDNLVRPLVISSATRVPFLLVMFGVLGGIAAFGLIGLFLGPVIVAVLLAVWREWLEEQTAH